MSPPTIQALAITQDWGPSLLDAMHALQALAAKRVAEQAVPGAAADGWRDAP